MPTPGIERDVSLYLGPRGFEQADFLMAAWQKFLAVILILGLVGACSLGYWSTLFLYCNAVAAAFFLLSTVYRLYLMNIALEQEDEIEVTADQLVPPRGGWPRYVIQVPLYNEPAAVPELVRSLSALDYPEDRLTIQLLLEADDQPTRRSVDLLDLPSQFRIVDIPVSYPRTKPKACNVGLALAQGDYLVIYDAEDRPEADQLKKAVIAFMQSGSSVACVQAKLNFYNAGRNLLTRLFSAEYALWFDLCLPGLDALRAPIPLGGTSNHFRLPILQELKGWDEFNVTEDCDLGLRLFDCGYQTRILNSTTWEEACPRLLPWLRQRSRWVKGYVQTYFVHTRRPFLLFRRLGLCNGLHFTLLIGGSVLAQLLAPIYWLLVFIWIACDLGGGLADSGWLSRLGEQINAYFPLPVFIMAAICLFIGNFAMVYASAVACSRRRFGSLIKFAPLMIGYWLIMSLAAWKGTLQLLWRPHYWEKTQHLDV